MTTVYADPRVRARFCLLSFSVAGVLLVSSAADVSCHPKYRNAQETAERPWESVGRGCVNIRDPGLRGAWTATRASDTAGRPAAPAPRGRGRVAEECRRRHDARASKRPRFFLCPWWQRSKRRGVAAGSRGAPQRACALLSCDAHCVCVPGAGLRTARTGQQGLAGLAD